MSSIHEFEHYRTTVKPALNSKVEEFSLLGYGTIHEQQLWDFLINKKWRKVKEERKLYEIIDDIMSVKAGEYMNYASVEALKHSEFSFDNEEDLMELLK